MRIAPTPNSIRLLPTDISDPLMQCPVFALMAHRAFDAFVSKNNSNPTALDLYLAQWPSAATATLSTDLQNALDTTAPLVGPAAAVVLGTSSPPPLTIPNPTQPPPAPPTGPFQLGSISPASQPMAQKILSAFANADFGVYQQATALANAIANQISIRTLTRQ